MSWKLRVSGYGKIKSAEIEMAPLTLFVGDNNSGKSYLMSLLWGIQNLGADILFGGETAEKTEAEKRLLQWVNCQVEKALEEGSHVIPASEIEAELQIVLQERLDRNLDKLVKSIFNSSDVGIKEIQIKLIHLDREFLHFDFLSVLDEPGFFLGIETDIGVRGFLFSEKERKDKIANEKQCWHLIKCLFDLMIGGKENVSVKWNTSVYLPAARTGFMLTKDVINKVGRMTAFNIGMETAPLVPFTRPINQFLDVINDLAFDSKGDEKFYEVIQYLEGGMTDGTVEMSSVPNKEVMYIPNGKTMGMPLRIVSAVVTELSPLILILKHKTKLHALFYEEPEMCLHPQLQQRMAKVICMLVNAGVQMNVTTHSDIILQHINNMIRLSQREDAEKICRQLGYGDQDLLNPDKVRVYQLKAEAGGKTFVEELKCGKNGFAIPTFNDALDQIMEEAYTIQE